MNEQNGKRLFHHAIFLTVAALLTKVLSIVYRIPYQNITGDVGFYIYQQVYPIHGIVFTLAMYGFPVVISKLLVEQNENRQHFISVAFFVLSLMSVVVFLILFFFAPLLAQFVGDEQLTTLYRTMAFAFLFVPFISVIRGVFQAEEQVHPTALSQLSEQLVRVVVIVVLAVYLISQGFSVYVVGTGAAFGSLAGGMASVLTLLCFYIYHFGNPMARFSFAFDRKQAMSITKRLVVQGFSVSIGALALIFFQFIDSLTVLNLLKQYGLSSFDAKVIKGVYDRGQPLLQLGFTLATSLSLVIVPTIAASLKKNDQQTMRAQAGFALKIALVISLAASVGLAIIIEPTNVMLFKDDRGSFVLAILGIAICFGSISLTAIAILQGMDNVNVTLFVVVLGMIVKIGSNVVFIPMYGISAAAVATVLGFAVMAIFSILYVQKQLRLFSHYRFYFVRIIGAASGMAVVAWVWMTVAQSYLFSSSRLGVTGTALSTVTIAVIVYFGLLFVCRVFSRSELAFMKKKGKGVNV
mgnify:CR=1 FL=1